MKKKNFKKLIPCIVFISLQSYAQQDLFGKTYFSPRSQTTNSARRLVGQTPYMNKTKGETYYGVFSATAEYLRAFKTRRVAEYFFGTNEIKFSGSKVSTRENTDVLADYFGLSPEYQGTLKLCPEARNFVMDFNLYVGLDGLYPGLYMQASIPAVWTKHWICLQENRLFEGNNTPYPEKYMATGELAAPAASPEKYFGGDLTWGDVKEGIKFGKIGCVQKTGVSDIWFAAGWNFIRRKRGHLGFNLQAAGPAGSRPNGVYMFEPVVGNGHHWEFGVGFNGGILLWEGDVTRQVMLNVETNFTRLFKARQCRTFDFKSPRNCSCPRSLVTKFASRFVLLKEFDETGNYTGTLIPAINKTTLPCKVWNSFKTDLTIMATYNDTRWTVDLGYNGWIRTKEKIQLCGTIAENKYALKGIQDVAGAGANNTQSNATVFGNVLTTQNQQNNADTTQTFISANDLDLCSAAAPTSITHKLFTHFSYAWDKDLYQKAIPFIGVGFQIEFEGVRPNDYPYYPAPDKNTMAQYGVWVKGGAAF